LSGGRVFDAEIKAIIETAQGKRLQIFIRRRDGADLFVAGCREIAIDLGGRQRVGGESASKISRLRA